MEEMKSKRRSVKRRSAAVVADEGSTPIPGGPGSDALCGHSGCSGGTCNVRYVGATSHPRDHHALHAARGVTHIWMAAIVTGVSMVLTGALAFTTVQAKTDQSQALRDGKSRADWVRIIDRLDKMDKALADVRVLCNVRVGKESSTSTSAQ